MLGAIAALVVEFFLWRSCSGGEKEAAAVDDKVGFFDSAVTKSGDPMLDTATFVIAHMNQLIFGFSVLVTITIGAKLAFKKT